MSRPIVPAARRSPGRPRRSGRVGGRGGRVRALAWGFALAEAPTPDPDPGNRGGLLVVNTLGGGIHRLDADGLLLEVLLADRKGIGGLAVHADGGLVAGGRDVLHLVPGPLVGGGLAGTGARQQVVLPRQPGVSGFNDLVATLQGGVLAGALRYRPLAGNPPVPGELVLASGSARSRRVSTWDRGTLTWPKGLGFSPDGIWLYAADFATGAVHRARWDPDRAQPLQPWVDTPGGQADGVDVDAADAVWAALGSGGGLARYLPDGTLDTVLNIPARFVSSCRHTGEDLRTLAVTTADNTERPDRTGTVFLTRTDVPGLPMPQART